MCMCLLVCVYHVNTDALKGQEEGHRPHGARATGAPQVPGGVLTLVLCKSSECSWPLSHLATQLLFIFYFKYIPLFFQKCLYFQYIGLCLAYMSISATCVYLGPVEPRAGC